MKFITKRVILLCSVLFTVLDVKAQEQKQYTPIINPVLPGFNPDPCIIRTGNDYYIVTSTFEWFPGLPVYHSTDLINWNQIGNVLTRKSQLDMTGISDADGVYAPSITYHNGLYYVIYTVVQDGLNWSMKGYPNYIVTASNPAGPWSDPVYINSLGFDPYLFIDDDGKGYVLTRIFDHREGKPSSPGIGMHQIDPETFKPVGGHKFIYSGWAEQSAEGPKILKKDGFYYLFTAEGGAGYGHYQAVARSENIWGPYERAPQLFYTSRHDSTAIIQKAGHGTLFTTLEREWYTTYLGSRPLLPQQYSPLGRETFIQKVYWNAEGWPELVDNMPAIEVPLNGTFTAIDKETILRDEFRTKEPDPAYLFLREPYDNEWLQFNQKESGGLALKGRNALGSTYRQSLIAKRVTSYNQEFKTCLTFEPFDFRHMAGLTCYYNTQHFYSLGLTYDEQKGTILALNAADKKYQELYKEKVTLDESGRIYLKLIINGYDLQFLYSINGTQWSKIGEKLDFTKISDEYANGFTGATVGLFAQDMLYSDQWGYFDYLEITHINTCR